MKILWVSDPPSVTSAYGQQTGLFVSRLRASGYDVSILAIGNGVCFRSSDGTLILPATSDRYGNGIVASHAKVLNADLVITLVDSHVLDPAVYERLPWCAWAPLDFDSVSRASLRSLKAARWVWSPSKAGTDAYREAGLKNVLHVPHGVDSNNVFYPIDKSTARRTLGASVESSIPDDVFLAVSVAANRGTPSRKGFYETFMAWKIFSDEHANSFLYLHTETSGLNGIGENLIEIMDLVGLSPERVIFPPQYPVQCGLFGPQHLATAYNAADVYLSTSHGEGFGIGSVEAQLCGCPVILPRNSAQTELCITGHLVATTPYLPFDGAALWKRPSIADTVLALKSIYNQKKTGELFNEQRLMTRRRVMNYEINMVFQEKMLPALRSINGLKP